MQHYRPVGLLQDYMLSCQILECDLPEEESKDITVLPHLAQQLIFHLGNGQPVYDINRREYFPSSAITGPADRITGLQIKGNTQQLIVSFRPGACFRLFRISPRDLCNRSADIAVILGVPANEAAARIRACTDHDQQVRILQSWLTTQLSGQTKWPRSIEDAINMIYTADGNITIRQLESAVFLTKRTLERSFLEQTGLHLKMFCRIVRFRKVLACMQRERCPNWSLLAQQAGYSDQTHFINEFHYFTQCLPHEYTAALGDIDQVWSM